MKFFISIAALGLLMISMKAFSQTVRSDEAILVAKNTAACRFKGQFTPGIRSIRGIDHEQIPVMYFVEMYPSGFVIVSGSKNVIPVLAWSDNTSLPEHTSIPAFNAWVEFMKVEISNAEHHRTPLNDNAKREWESMLGGICPDTRGGVSPLLYTQWGQETYYNEFCPKDVDGPDDKCVTGCVATAIGQLMNYFRWPLQGTGFYTSEDTVYGTLSVDYSSADYHYNEMAADLSRTNPETAELIYHIGVSVDMHYGPNGSGMNNHKAAHTMKTFFSYADSTQYIFRDSVSMNWDSVVVSHLERGLPMYYAGWGDTNYISGHAFVVDGYQDSLYFHFNWGWNGSYDGYFYTSSLSPGGANFTLMHELVINMTPQGMYPYTCQGTDTLRSNDGTIDDGSGPIFPYQENRDCYWLIEPNDSVEYIQLDFLRFNTESGQDVLTVYDGSTTSSGVLGSFSGSALPSSIQSTGKSMLLHFVSNHADSSDGFLVSYMAHSPSFCSTLSTLNAESDTIGDGSQEFDYHGNIFCRWKIQPTSGLPVLLTFDEFEMDSTDYVRVLDHSTGDILGEYRGNTLPPVQYSSNGTLTLYFKTSATSHADGFTAHYRTSQVSVAEMNQTSMTVFPNPATEYIYLNGIEGVAEIVIYDTQGRKMLNLKSVGNNDVIPIQQLSSGYYFLTVLLPETQRTFSFYKQL